MLTFCVARLVELIVLNVGLSAGILSQVRLILMLLHGEETDGFGTACLLHVRP